MGSLHKGILLYTRPVDAPAKLQPLRFPYCIYQVDLHNHSSDCCRAALSERLPLHAVHTREANQHYPLRYRMRRMKVDTEKKA